MAAVDLPGGFWLQHAAREADELIAFANELAATGDGRPGVVIAPVNAADRVDSLYRTARAAGAVILDPNGHLLDRDHTERSRNHFPWLARTPRPDDQAGWEAWMSEALEHQRRRRRSVAPSVLVTPCPIIEAAAGQDELYTVLDAAQAVAGPSEEECWLGLNVDRTYVRDDSHLTRLADSLVDAAPAGVVLRAFHRELPPVSDRSYLVGLGDLVHAMAENGTRVFLPQAGWLGWLAMAWGAWGFSGGMAAGTWGDREPGPMTRPDEPSLPYFEPQLLRTVRWRVHEELAGAADHRPCDCDDCAAMGGTFDLRRAKRHQMRHAHGEAARLASAEPRVRAGAVSARLDQAIAFRDDLSRALRARVGADFLDRWRDLV